MDHADLDEWLDEHGVPDKDAGSGKRSRPAGQTPFQKINPPKQAKPNGRPPKQKPRSPRSPFSKDDAELFQSMMDDAGQTIDPKLKHGKKPPEPKGPEEARPFRKLEPENYRHRPKIKTGSFIRNDIGLFEETIARLDGEAIHDKDDAPKAQSRRLYGVKNPELVPIDATLDLHGRTVAEAEYMLTRFLDDCVHRNRHVILIVHGKGNHTRGGDSKIRRMVRHRLSNAGKMIYKVIRAPSNRGGDGATMVWLR